jgi:tripartite-type tricarboxylate transporter receptor subunit TctC
MKLPRRKFLHLAAGAATLPSLSLVASADDYPTRPVRIVAGFAAGGAVDIVARLIAQWLSDQEQLICDGRAMSALTPIATGLLHYGQRR